MLQGRKSKSVAASCPPNVWKCYRKSLEMLLSSISLV